MQNQTINLKNLSSSIGIFSLFLIFCGYELKAESLSAPEKKYVASNKIKWSRYYEFSKDKEIQAVKKVFEEPNKQLITNDKKKAIIGNKELEVIDKINQKANLSTTSFPQSLEGLKNIFVASKEEESDVLISEIIPVLSLYAVAGYRLLPAVQNIYSAQSMIKYNRPALMIIINEKIS